MLSHLTSPLALVLRRQIIWVSVLINHKNINKDKNCVYHPRQLRLSTLCAAESGEDGDGEACVEAIIMALESVR